MKRENIDQKRYLMENLALCLQNTIMVKKDVVRQMGMLNERQMGWTDDGLVVAVGMRYPLIHCGSYLCVNKVSMVRMTANKWNMYRGCKMMVEKYKKDIIRYASLQRYILWRIRLLSAYCFAKEADSKDGVRKIIWQLLHEGIRDRIKPYFQIYCE